MRAYCRQYGPRASNFGDALVPHILKSVLNQDVTGTTDFKEADIVSIGSIVQDIPGDYSGVIWGTGLMFEGVHRRFPSAKIAAVRGPLTGERMGLAEVVYGDPGILADRLQTAETKRYALGIVPHYVDYDNPVVYEFAKRYCEVKVIDSCQPPLNVLREIAQCETILSSSLHGMIVAHSLGLPAAWTVLGDQVQGGTFKFRDYLAAYGFKDVGPCELCASEPLAGVCYRIRHSPQPDLMESKEQLVTALKAAL